MRQRRAGVEEKKDLRKAVMYAGGGIAILVFFLYVGVPLLAKFAIFLGSFKENKEVAGDTVPPAPPRLSPVQEYIREESIIVRGFSEAGSEIELVVNGESTADTITDEGGEFMFTQVKIASGSNEIYVVAKDKNNNKSQPSGKLRVILDTLPPQLTVNTPSDGQLFSGQDNKNIKVAGLTEENVAVRINGRAVVVDNNGSFETNLVLADGEQEITVSATDRAGNSTETKVTVTFNP